MAEQFSDFIQQERDRLNRERENVFNQQEDLKNKLVAINRELAAIEAYESAKTGKASRARAGRQAPRRQRARTGSRREALLQVIKDNPGGLKRGEIIEKMGLKGDKSGEMSVSNALTALTKNNQISRREGKYVPSA